MSGGGSRGKTDKMEVAVSRRRSREMAPAVALIDGCCNLCHGIVRFVVARDHAGQFRFAPLQSNVGKRLLVENGLPTTDLDTFVLIDSGRCYTKSAAALRVFWRLGGGWRLLYGLIAVPRFVRDAVYDWIAGGRYRWFGKNEACLVPTDEIRSRFLEDEVEEAMTGDK